MIVSKDNTSNEPFYKPVYDQILTRLEDGEPVDSIYDDRGVNISKQLGVLVGERSYEKTMDFGCGLGQVSVSLSTKSKLVVAADISKNALKIVTKVAKMKNINNIHPMLFDATNLPFKDNVFDLIVCSGVLEWVPLSHGSCPPERLQLNTLTEIRRVLTWRSLFWLGIENRYCYYYLLGAIDHHSRLRFVTFLPRSIANFYSKLVKKQQYRNYLYSYWELMKILRKSGLTVNKFLTATPYYSNPKIIADLSNPNEIGDIFSHTSYRVTYRAIIKAISKFHTAKLLIPNFIVICTKSQ
jgi:ubiquinone/menaquinone biosynthesis C-methylase UbiE